MKHKSLTKILILSILLALIFSSMGVRPARADGPFSHTTVVKDAYDLLPGSELKSLLGEYLGIVQAGSVFPDWGMASTGDYTKELAECAHWQGFTDAYIDHLMSMYSSTHYATPEAKKSIAFLFGIIAHQIADNLFHYDLLPYAQDIDNSSHTAVEMGVDSFNISFAPIGFVDYTVYWSFLPEEIINAAYADLYTGGAIKCNLVDLDDLRSGWARYMMVSYGQVEAELLSYEYFHLTLPNTLESFIERDPGGMNDSAQHTVIAWLMAWEYLNGFGRNYAKLDGNSLRILLVAIPSNLIYTKLV